MRRVIVSALALALLPAAVFAQDPPAQQQPPAQQPAQQPAAPAQPAEPKLTFSGPAGLLLVQIKPDQTAAFEEMVGKLKAGLAASTDEAIKTATTGFKVYKAAEPMAGNALYVVVVDPATAKQFKKWADAFAAGYNKLNLTPVGGI